MPRGDGTGPVGMGRNVSRGRGAGRGGMGGFAAGPGGECMCPACGKRVSHQRGVSCSSVRCPQCGAATTRT